jgi:hypothetical protein
MDVIKIHFSKAFNLVPHDRWPTKVVASGMDFRIVVWVREFLVGNTQKVREGKQLFKEVKVTSEVLQGSMLGPLLFLAKVNDIWRNTDSSIRLFADNCIIYRKNTNKKTKKSQKDLDTLGECDENKS